MVTLRYARLLVLLLLATGSAHGQQRWSFSRYIDEQLAKPSIRHAIWGIRIEAENGELLYDLNSDRMLAPASNRKLGVAAFAAECLGIETRLQTRVLITGAVSGGVLRGDVVVRGDGDPSLGGRFDFDRDRTLEPMLAALRDHGVRRIEGGVVADVSLFADDLIPGSWKNDNLGEDYAAPVDALAWNENVVGFRAETTGCPDPVAAITLDPDLAGATAVIECDAPAYRIFYRADDENHLNLLLRGPADVFPRVAADLAAIENPGLYAAQAVDDFLRRRGVAIANSPAVSRKLVEGQEIAAIASPYVANLLAPVLEPSQNLYAEMLLKRTAAVTRPAPIDYGTAVAAEEEFLVSIGVDGEQVRFLDGSGLSPDDLVTNRALIRIIRWMAEPPREGFFRQLLARPGGEGTLRNRLAGYETRVSAKTGTINTVAALTGWAITRSGEKRFFSIVVNHHTTTFSDVRQTIDAITRHVADW